MNRAKADRILPGIIQKLVRNSDGTYRLRETDIDGDEKALIECLCGTFIAKIAFDGARLYDDFSATLKSHGLLRKDEFSTFARLSIPISLFAITVMHNCAIKVDDNLIVTLKARAEPELRQVAVSCTIPPHYTSAHKGVSLASFIFKVDIPDPAGYLDPMLPNGADWDFDLEISVEGRLIPIR
jgi:hypothetical protein